MRERRIGKGERVALFLVTGGCGFIGSHLCDALVARGDGVRVIDDLSTGFVANLPPEAEFLHGDVCDTSLVDAAADGVDGVFHLAAIASVERGLREWVHTNRVNLGGTIAVLDAVRKRRPGVRVVYASSAAVYGDCASLPIRESAGTHPLSAYGADKLGSELHARVATRTHGIPTVGLRFFNVYGPRQNPASPYSGVISIFADRLRRHEGVTVFGDGLQTRDFVYVGDVVAALLQAMTVPLSDAAVFNVCTGRAVTLRRLVSLIAALSGAAPTMRSAPAREGDIRHSVGSRVSARRSLRLPPATPLRAGLAALLAQAGDAAGGHSNRHAAHPISAHSATDPAIITAMAERQLSFSSPRRNRARMASNEGRS